jgi:hypothetical protein
MTVGIIGTVAKHVGGDMTIEQFLLIAILVLQILSFKLR